MTDLPGVRFVVGVDPKEQVSVGDRVRNPAFGMGSVLAVGERSLQVRFDDGSIMNMVKSSLEMVANTTGAGIAAPTVPDVERQPVSRPARKGSRSDAHPSTEKLKHLSELLPNLIRRARNDFEHLWDNDARYPPFEQWDIDCWWEAYIEFEDRLPDLLDMWARRLSTEAKGVARYEGEASALTAVSHFLRSLRPPKDLACD